MQFDISLPDQSMREALQEKIDNLTKPKGSLGRLEDLAMQVGMIQHTLRPELKRPCNVLFGADHGIVSEGVTVSPKDVTWQQMLHFGRGGAGISFLCHQHGFRLVVVDAGVDYDFPTDAGIIDMKVARGTRNYLHEAAMTMDQWQLCLHRGAEVVTRQHEQGTNVISFGEMGSGNTSSTSLWMHMLTGVSLEQCVGAGAGLDKPGIQHKYDVLSRALNNYRNDGSIEERLAWFGGFEMAMAVGGMLRAAELGMVVLVDGFIMTACMLAATRLNPNVAAYAVYGHQGDEAGHKLLLDALHARPLLHLGLRLGEGTGAVCAYPILESAVRMINEMDSFQSVDVTKYF